MKTLEMDKAWKPLSAYAADLGSESLLIVSKKKPVAALVSLKEADRESVALSLSPMFAKIIRRARAEAKRGKVYSLDEVKKELLAETAAPKTKTTLEPRSRARSKSQSQRNSRAARG